MQWYLKVLKNYIVFKGRARRKEYWMFFLIDLIISTVLERIETVGEFDPLLSVPYHLATLLPYFAVATRRLHDTGRSGWWFLIGLIPIIGIIILIVFLCQDSEPNSNKYGSNPKY
ncbi:DUF805 domain-containing protein [Metabacillus fastidiosus]|uniref:DUF805 domain-containing protein n=1 Tax=Metabacillus fastidiosus TaxID=1458 RepID=UPI002E1C2865|nr:DUF805 domain-containing protein [Metabacillus fastidiosus]